MAVETFQVSVPDVDVRELGDRLRRTRWSRRLPMPAWSGGTDPDALLRLVSYWDNGYDWRAHESVINRLPHRVAKVEGKRLHFLHFHGEQDDALPIVLTHGWPSSFLELIQLADRLAYPTKYGRPGQDAFHVVVPSLPGFAFSEQRGAVCADLRTHELWHRLMRDELGYQRYAA